MENSNNVHELVDEKSYSMSLSKSESLSHKSALVQYFSTERASYCRSTVAQQNRRWKFSHANKKRHHTHRISGKLYIREREVLFSQFRGGGWHGLVISDIGQKILIIWYKEGSFMIFDQFQGSIRSRRKWLIFDMRSDKKNQFLIPMRGKGEQNEVWGDFFNDIWYWHPMSSLPENMPESQVVSFQI